MRLTGDRDRRSWRRRNPSFEQLTEWLRVGKPKSISERLKTRAKWVGIVPLWGWILAVIPPTVGSANLRSPWAGWVGIFLLWCAPIILSAFGLATLLSRRIECPRCHQRLMKAGAYKLASCPQCGLDFRQPNAVKTPPRPGDACGPTT